MRTTGKATVLPASAPALSTSANPRRLTATSNPPSLIPGEESALALFGYLPSAQNSIYGSSNCNTTSSKRTAQPVCQIACPAASLPAYRPLNRPPGWTTPKDRRGEGWRGGRQQFSFSWSARANASRSLARTVPPSAASGPVSPTASSALRGE